MLNAIEQLLHLQHLNNNSYTKLEEIRRNQTNMENET